MTREEYWNTTIAFDCPITKKRHTIENCLDMCEFWGREYKKDADGRIAAFLFCEMDCMGERFLDSGEITRNN